MGRHTLFTSGARLLRYCKVRTNRGPSSLKGQRMTHREWTIDGVTKTIVNNDHQDEQSRSKTKRILKERIWTVDSRFASKQQKNVKV